VDASEFRLQPVPPKGPAPLRLVRVKTHRMNPYYFTILSPAFWGIYTHWTGDCTSPCLKSKEKCPGCKLRRGRKWLGYLHVLDEAGEECLIELTKRAANMLLAEVPPLRILRGLRVAVQRSQGGKSGRLNAKCVGVSARENDLPKAKDPAYTMMFVYGLADDLDDLTGELLA
jgi:hypothetical protein